MRMSLNFDAALRRFACMGIVSLLAACANLEPGMRVDANSANSAVGAQATVHGTPNIRQITAAMLEEQRAALNQAADQQIKQLLGEPRPYLIGAGDLLSILVWDHPELNIAAAGAQALTSSGAQSPAAFVVDQQGMIQFPYVGTLKIAGLTEQQARQLLGE
jgi:polysaccharide export outer membrane protein